MLVWAQQRIARELPQYNTATVTTLLRAENRTVCAVLNCRSTVQLTAVLEAALRRAGLKNQQPAQQADPPQQDQQQQQPQQDAAPAHGTPIHIQQLVEAMHRQTMAIQTILSVTQHQPTSPDFMNFVATLQVQNHATIQAIAGFTQVLARLERRIEAWETTYLAELMDRLPLPVPQTPMEMDIEAQRSDIPPMPEAEATQPYTDQQHAQMQDETPEQAQAVQPSEVQQEVQSAQTQHSHQEEEHEGQQGGDQGDQHHEHQQDMQQDRPDSNESQPESLVLSLLQERSMQSQRARASLRPFGRP